MELESGLYVVRIGIAMGARRASGRYRSVDAADDASVKALVTGEDELAERRAPNSTVWV